MNLFQRQDPEVSYNRLIIKYNSWQTPVLRRGSHRLSYNGHAAVLTAKHDPIVGQRFLLDPLSYYVIVREGDKRILPFNRKTSRRHIRIDSENKRYVITYLNSTNHTYINGKMVTRAVLNNNSVIKIGDSYSDLRG